MSEAEKRIKMKTGQIIVLTPLLFCLILLFSCNQNKPKGKKVVISSAPATHDFAKELSGIFFPVDSPTKKELYEIDHYLHFAYQLNEYAPFWIKDNKHNEAAEKLLSEISDIYYDGIDTSRYHLNTLRNLLAEADSDKSAEKQIAYDTAFTYAYLQASHELLFGKIKPAIADSLWFHANDSVWTAPAILTKKGGNFPSLDVYRSKLPTYKLMRDQYRHYTELANDSKLTTAISIVKNIINWAKPDSEEKSSLTYVIKSELPWLDNLNDSINAQEKQMIRNYQYYMDIKVSGKLDSFTLARLSRTPTQMLDELKINMERMRWMQQDAGGNTYIVIDVPLMELFFIKDSMDVMHMNTVVGRTERQTPSLVANMANVVINPPWGVPPTILKKDVLPGITKSGKKYLAKKGLNVYDRHGTRIDPGKVNPRNYKAYIYKQDPGDDNSLGYVKFNMPNPYDIYMHDTPHRGDFVKRNRFLSSGCVRLQHPQDMALYILSDLEGKRYTQERLDSVIQTHKTRFEILKSKIPVHIVYLTNFEDSAGNHLRFARDIYGRNERLLNAMQ
jgi:murein L,D-transpeptidase YcbB/YkuD